jgi:hypothetical protein
MSHFDNVIDIRRPVDFSIDGRAYRTSNRWQPAVNLLLLAGLDPALYRLCEVRPRRVNPVRYGLGDIVTIRRGTRFVAVRDQADVI